MNCDEFADQFCEHDQIKDKFFKYSSKYYDYPEDNCCACGKDTSSQDEHDIFHQSRDFNQCTHKDREEKHKKIIKYCEEVGDDYIKCNKERGDHCI